MRSWKSTSLWYQNQPFKGIATSDIPHQAQSWRRSVSTSFCPNVDILTSWGAWDPSHGFVCYLCRKLRVHFCAYSNSKQNQPSLNRFAQLVSEALLSTHHGQARSCALQTAVFAGSHRGETRLNPTPHPCHAELLTLCLILHRFALILKFFGEF
jgi:hypothetical protein